MSRVVKSQWEFGELFQPAAPTRRVYAVSELTGAVRRLLEKELGRLWVAGEITNLREQASGHVYFSIKDVTAQLQCVCFRTEARAIRALLKDGQKVLLEGELTVYEARGQYQLVVRAAEAQGLGALQQAFERLKQKLDAEGLFATERKRPLPRLPRCLGLVTSPTGAAWRDVLTVVARRQPALRLLLAPCRVQGQGAAEEIAAAIARLNAYHENDRASEYSPDLILVTRGGGSLEDLWAFNEEVVARAVFHSRLPVVSAVGHEIDFTISDFVADLRAATPSAAAEIITEGAFAARQVVADSRERLCRLARQRLENARVQARQWQQRLARLHPRRQLNEQRQRLDDAQSALLRATCQRLLLARTAWETHAQRLARVRPAQVLSRRRQEVDALLRRLRESTRQGCAALRQRQQQAEIRLRLLSPLEVLQRGYSITTDAASGQVIRDAAQAKAGQRMRTRVHTGQFDSMVEN